MASSTTRSLSLVCLLGLILTSAPGLSATMDCSGTKERIKETLSSETIKPGDVPDRELVQTVRVDIISSANPEFDGIEETVYLQMDSVGGAGDHYGYAAFMLNSGEKIWGKFHGTHYFVPKSEDDWEVPFHGVFRYIAGTGKYKAIRGGGHYEGKVTPTGIVETISCSAEY
jgi:hypothetical protein